MTDGTDLAARAEADDNSAGAVRPRVALVDDLHVVRAGFAATHPRLEVVATYPTVEQFLRDAPEVDAVVSDLKLANTTDPGVLQGRRAIRALADEGLRVCIYTEESRPFVLAQCLRAGARGITHKYDDPEVTTDAIIRVAAGQFVITPGLVGVAEVLQRHGQLPEVTDKQLEVLRERARGLSWQQIAGKHYITVASARNRMDAVTEKFAGYLRNASPADIEREFGLRPGDLLDE